jgi:hypothetical protein
LCAKVELKRAVSVRMYAVSEEIWVTERRVTDVAQSWSCMAERKAGM